MTSAKKLTVPLSTFSVETALEDAQQCIQVFVGGQFRLVIVRLMGS